MRVVRFILGTLAVALAVWVLMILAPWFVKSPYLRFVDQDQKYYAEVARACDLMLAQHPIGTNDSIRIEGGDASMPEIIRDLHPSRVTISSNRVHVMVGVRDFGMSWEAQDGGTNSWTLSVYPEGPEKTLYVEKR